MTADPPAVRLDEGALARLRELDPDGRHDVLGRVLRTFEASLARQLGVLQAEAGHGRATAVANLAHLLKSSAGSVGALALAQCCAEVEQQRRDGQAQGLDDDIQRLITEGQRALQAVRAILRD